MQTLKQIISKLDGTDPYDMLETKPTDDFMTLKKNYRVLALRYHPDRNKQQSAKDKFIKINLAYEFLEQEVNRQIYQNHLKAIQEQKERQSKMSDDRKRMLEELKRRQQEFQQRRKDMAEELKRKKEFFQKKMKQEQERELLREQILNQMKLNQYYQELTSIKVQWQNGLSFTKYLLLHAFQQYGKVLNVNLEAKSRQAIVSFSSIDVCTNVVNSFNHPQVKIDFLVDKVKRQKLLKALKNQKINKSIDFSLTSQNLARLKEVLNRGSSIYLEGTSRINLQ